MEFSGVEIGFFNTVLKSYGLIGFCIVLLSVSAAWFGRKITMHFIAQVSEFHKQLRDRDAQLFKITRDFSSSIRELSAAIDRDAMLKKSFLDLSSKVEEGLVNLGDDTSEILRILQINIH